MSTVIRPELSSKNTYYVEKHRYYELKHFCLQYPIWKKAYESLDGLAKRPSDLHIFTTNHSDPTLDCIIAMDFYSSRMAMVEQTAKRAGGDLQLYLLRAVTEGLSYNTLATTYRIPCCKDTYYKIYRHFFWLLNKARE